MSEKREASKLRRLSSVLPLPAVRKRPGYHWYVVSTVCVGAFMAALDASIINIALPVLKRQFDVPMNIIEWISLVYLLTLAGLIVPFGRLADMFGRRWMYAFGFSVFIIGSVLCGISPNLDVMLGSRILQAIGAAMLQANSVSIITAATPASARGKAIGIQASAQGIGLSLGPAIGGTLLSFFTWRWIFLINLPVGIIGTTLGILMLPPDAEQKRRERFDYLGALFLTPALVALIYFLNMGLSQGWLSPTVLASYAVFIVCFGLFLWVERRAKMPMVDLSMFKSPVFSLGNFTGVLSFAVMYAVLLLAPFYLDNVQKMSSFTSGLYLTIIPIGMTLFTPLSGAIADRFGSRLPTMSGMVAGAVGCVILAFMGGSATFVFLIVGLFLVGAGTGIFTPPNNSSVMGSVSQNRLGVAGGILNMSRTLGMGLGITLGGMTYQLFLSAQGASEHAAKSHQMIAAFHWSFIVVAVIAAIAFLLSAIKQASTSRLPSTQTSQSH